MQDRSFGMAAFSLFSAVLAIVLFFITFGSVPELKEERKAQIAIVNMFEVDGTNAAQARKRQELARAIITVRGFDSSIPEFQDAQLEKQLSTIAKTGQPLNLQPVELNRQGRFMSLLFWWTLGTLCLSWLGYGLRYMDLCYSKGYRLWALVPWHRRWAWIVPLRAPWLVPFLISSFLWAGYKARRANKAAPSK